MADYYEISEFAELKNCTRQTIYSAVKRGEVEASRLYGKLLVRKSAKNKKWEPQENKKRF